MYPVLFTVGRWPVPTYTILLDMGLVLGLLLIYLEGKRLLGEGQIALDLGLWVLVGGLLGGRIGFVLANWTVFGEDWTRVVRIWEGGLSFHGAFLGGFLAMMLYASFHSRGNSPISYWQLADVVMPGLAVGIVFGWAACLMGACAYGMVGEGLGHLILPDLSGIDAPRFATQVVGLAYAIALLTGFWLLRKRWPFRGAAFLMYVLLYSAGMFMLSSTRGDETIYFGSWRLGQGIDLVLAAAAGVLLLILWWRARKDPIGLESSPGFSERRDPQIGEQAAGS